MENQPIPGPSKKQIATLALNPRCADCIYCERDGAMPGYSGDANQLPLRCHLNPPSMFVNQVPVPNQVHIHGKNPQMATQLTTMFPVVAPEMWCGNFDDGAEPAEAH